MWRWVKTISAYIFLFLCFIGYRLYYFTDSGINQFVIYSTAQHAIIIFLIYQIVKLIPYSDINKKVSWLYLLLFYAPAAMGFYLYAKYKTLSGVTDIEYVANWGSSMLQKSAAYRTGLLGFLLETLFIPALTIIILYVLDRLTKNMSIKSDQLDDEHIFLFIIKPKSINGLIMAAFKTAPISGLFLYVNKSVN